MENGVLFSQEDFIKFQNRLHTQELAEILRASTIGIAGVGGLGSNAAVALARSGIGKLILADFDRVEISNLNRQAFFIDQIGKYKTEAIAETLERINPYMEIELHTTRLDAEQSVTLFRNCDVVIEAVDMAETKVMLIESVLSGTEVKAVVAGSGMAGYGKNNLIKEIRSHRLILVGDGVSETAEGVPLMAPRVAVVSSMEANAAVEAILDGIQ